MNNPPQPQGDELDKASMLGADRGWDKTKIKNEGVPVDSALTGIPIAILGKDRKFGETTVAAFLRPDYEVVKMFLSPEEVYSELEGLTEPKPKALFIGGGFPQEEQDEVERKLQGKTDIKIVKSLPASADLLKKLEALPMEDKIPRVVKARLDEVRDQLVHVTETAKAVTQNAV